MAEEKINIYVYVCVYFQNSFYTRILDLAIQKSVKILPLSSFREGICITNHTSTTFKIFPEQIKLKTGARLCPVQAIGCKGLKLTGRCSPSSVLNNTDAAWLPLCHTRHNVEAGPWCWAYQPSTDRTKWCPKPSLLGDRCAHTLNQYCHFVLLGWRLVCTLTNSPQCKPFPAFLVYFLALAALWTPPLFLIPYSSSAPNPIPSISFQCPFTEATQINTNIL